MAQMGYVVFSCTICRYQRCYKIFDDCNENARLLSEESNDSIEFITDIDEAQSVNDLDGSIYNLAVYVDVIVDKKSNPARIYFWGRFKSNDVIYVTQRYSQIPKMIKDNCNRLGWT